MEKVIFTHCPNWMKTLFAVLFVLVGTGLAAQTSSPGTPISTTLPPTTDDISVATGGGIVSDVSITNLDISHTWVGDLTITLESPSGTTITLTERPGSFGGGGLGLLHPFRARLKFSR